MESLIQALDRYQRTHRHAAEPVPGQPGRYRCPCCGYELTFPSLASWREWHNMDPWPLMPRRIRQVPQRARSGIPQMQKQSGRIDELVRRGYHSLCAVAIVVPHRNAPPCDECTAKLVAHLERNGKDE
jgi:hypothetical protein